MRPGLLLSVALGLAMASACGSARRGQPFAAPERFEGAALDGQRVFMKQCNQCHPEGEGGLGPAINNKPLPATAIRLQVRTGVGEMPSFGEEEISDEALSALTEYLSQLRSREE